MTLKRCLTILLLLLAAAFAPGAHAQQPQPEYRLGDGDNIRVIVFQNPDLTLEMRVSENGLITFPLIGTVKIGGMTLDDAATTIGNALRSGGFIQKPQVTIQLLLNRGNQISLLGLVGRPGRFPLDTFNTRLSEMLAIAGGIGSGGADTVILTGTRNGKPYRKEIDIVAMFLENRMEDDITVAGGDVIYVQRQPMYYIYGEVQRAGPFRIERNMTIRQALVQAGGTTQRGTERNLSVFRRGSDGKVTSAPVDLNNLVQPDDVLHVKESLF